MSTASEADPGFIGETGFEQRIRIRRSKICCHFVNSRGAPVFRSGDSGQAGSGDALCAKTVGRVTDLCDAIRVTGGSIS